jgi:hypothetical protein
MPAVPNPHESPSSRAGTDQARPGGFETSVSLCVPGLSQPYYPSNAANALGPRRGRWCGCLHRPRKAARPTPCQAEPRSRQALRQPRKSRPARAKDRWPRHSWRSMVKAELLAVPAFVQQWMRGSPRRAIEKIPGERRFPRLLSPPRPQPASRRMSRPYRARVRRRPPRRDSPARFAGPCRV